MPKPKAKKKSEVTAPAAERVLMFPEPVSEVCVGENAITVTRAKELLGWGEETDDIKFGKHEVCSEIEPFIGHRVRLLNNPNNRPITVGNMLDLRQTILTKKWRFNGEPIIVSKTGLILNGQHTLLALMLAEHERTKGDNKDHWEKIWNGPCTIEKMIVFGIDDSDEVVNTMDTCKSRSLADVIYRADHFKAMNLDSGKRRKISKVMEHAVRLLWDRTGAGLDAFSPRRTTLECVDFINRHSRLCEAVKHIWEENGDTDELTNYITLGYASGILYLMGTSKSNGETYRGMEVPNEGVCDFSNWEKALGFWTTLVSGDQRDVERFSKPLKEAIGMLTDVETGRTGTLSEKIAIFWKAWEAWLGGKALTKDVLKLQYQQRQDGGLKLLDKPNFGGIDFYGIDSDEDDEDPELSPEEVASNAAEEKAKKLNKKSEGKNVGMIEEFLKNAANTCPGGPNSLLIFKTKNDMMNIWLDDADLVGKIIGTKPDKRPDGTKILKFSAAELNANLSLIRINGINGRPIFVVTNKEDSDELEYQEVTKPTPKVNPTPKVVEPEPEPKPEPTPKAKNTPKPKQKGPALRGGNG